MPNTDDNLQTIVQLLTGLSIIFVVQNSRRLASAVIPYGQGPDSTIADNQHRDAEIASLEVSVFLLESLGVMVMLTGTLLHTICGKQANDAPPANTPNNFSVKLIYPVMACIAVNGIYAWNHDVKATTNGKLNLSSILFSPAPFAADLQLNCLFIKLSSARFYKDLSRIPVIYYSALLSANAFQKIIPSLSGIIKKLPAAPRSWSQLATFCEACGATQFLLWLRAQTYYLHKQEIKLLDYMFKSLTPISKYLDDTWPLHLTHGLCVAACIAICMPFKINRWLNIILHQSALSSEHVFEIAKIDTGMVTSFMLPMMILTMLASIVTHPIAACCSDICISRGLKPEEWAHRQLGISVKAILNRCLATQCGGIYVAQIALLILTSIPWFMALHSPQRGLIINIFKLYIPLFRIPVDITQILYNSAATGRSIQIMLILLMPSLLVALLAAIVCAKPSTPRIPDSSQQKYSIIADTAMTGIIISMYFLLEGNLTGKEATTLVATLALLLGFCFIKNLPYLNDLGQAYSAEKRQPASLQDSFLTEKYDQHEDVDIEAYKNSEQEIAAPPSSEYELEPSKLVTLVINASIFAATAYWVYKKSNNPAAQCLPAP